jgi:hypothetical protein
MGTWPAWLVHMGCLVPGMLFQFFAGSAARSVVCNIRLANMEQAKSLAVALGNYILDLPDTDTRRVLLTHAPSGTLTSIIDPAPYNKSQVFR